MPSSEQELAALQKAWEKLQAEDSMAVCAEFEAIDDPEQTARIYAKFANWLYNEKREIAWMIAFSRAGIQFCLREAARLEKSDPEKSLKLKGLAKGISYNLGANLWPGWDDPGVTLTPEDLKLGLDAAELNLRLGRELKRNAMPMGNAHWLVGAQHLAQGESLSAIASFKQALEEFQKADKRDFQLMVQGYLALSEELFAQEESLPLAEIIGKLKETGTEDGPFFAEQLRTAKKVFMREGEIRI